MKSDVEHKIQSAFIKLARMWLPDERIVYAIPNQGEGSKVQGAKFKREGRLPGIPDVFVAWARLGYNGLYIEFKKPKPNKSYLSTSQKTVIPQLRNAGYCVAVCRDAEDAFNLLRRYALGSKKEHVMQDHNWK
jgi:hypothetical protein